MNMIPAILFLFLSIIAIYFFYKKIQEIKRNIFLGKAENLNDQPRKRLKNVILLALGQKKMFKNPLVAILHLFVYIGFIIINLEVTEIILDGILNTHRLFLPFFGEYYTHFINCFEILALLVLIGCLIFLLRRNIVRVKRLNANELNGFPKSDANYILITEIILMSLFLIMNSSDLVLQSLGHEHYSVTGQFIISSHLKFLFNNLSITNLLILERTCWWLHIIGIYAFLNYLPYSKHLHIFLAFPNAYYAKLTNGIIFKNMASIQQEVLYAMQPELAPTEASAVEKFGAKDVMDLSWKNLLDAYSCTECGRCSAACPANITGKLLSPRAIMMKTRDRLEEVGRNININKSFVQDNKTLLYDYISESELRACTTCNACVEECPVSISPLDIIIELRRNLIMEDSKSTKEWNSMFGNIENNFSPWKFSPDDRENWLKEN